MGADGHIAIYDYEKIQAYLVERKDKYIPNRKTKLFSRDQSADANQFAKSVRSSIWTRRKGYLTGYGENDATDDGVIDFMVSYDDETDMVPHGWPGYICDWACNGRPACLTYWGDNLDCDPFEDCEWLREWADQNAVLVRDQEVWT